MPDFTILNFKFSVPIVKIFEFDNQNLTFNNLTKKIPRVHMRLWVVCDPRKSGSERVKVQIPVVTKASLCSLVIQRSEGHRKFISNLVIPNSVV